MKRRAFFGLAIGPLVAGAISKVGYAQSAAANWIYLGLVADTAGAPNRWLGETGFAFSPADPQKIVPKVGDRIQLTSVKQIRTTDAQGQRPFERQVSNPDTVGEYKPGTVLQVLEIGRRNTSKAGDRWDCWVRVGN